MNETNYGHRSWLAEVDAAAKAGGIDTLDLVDTLLHREFCLDRERWGECLAVAAGQVQWHIDHRRAIEEQQYTGVKYDRALSTKQIAVLARAEVKRLGCKASVRSSYNSIAVDLRAGAEPLLDAEGNVTDYAERMAAQVADFLAEYNFDQGDDWTDYTCLNFFTTITVLDLPSGRYCG
jgi:hypothetical protein